MEDTRKRAKIPLRGLVIGFFVFIPATATAQLNIVLTNDDGYKAQGVRILRSPLVAAGHNAVIVAPLKDQSGRGTGIFNDPQEKLKTAV